MSGLVVGQTAARFCRHLKRGRLAPTLRERMPLKSILNITGAALVFFHFGVLQIWKIIPPATVGPIPDWLGLSVAVVASVGSAVLVRCCFLLGAPKEESLSPVAYLGPLGVSLVCWALWSLPRLFLPLQTFGDEDYHFTTTIRMQEYLATLAGGRMPDGAGPHLLRYPALFYLLLGVFPNLDFTDPHYVFFQRLPLAIPYVALVIASYAFAIRLGSDKTRAWLLSLVTATSPLLLCYTSDKFLDISHPLLFFAGFASLTLGALRHRSWFAVAIWCAGLLPLLRDNGLPTTLVLAGAVALFELFGGRFVSAAVAFVVGAGPGLAYYVLKTLGTAVDSARLSASHLGQQDYDLFFAYLPVYLPWALVLTAGCGLWAWRGTARRVVLCATVASLLGQMAIYALFEPGWMPWSRNYLMFFGQVLFLGCVGAPTRGVRRALFFAGALGLNVATNIYLNCFELPRNRLFHEPIAVYRYDHLSSFIAANPEVLPPNSTVYMSVPAAVPLAFKVVPFPGIEFKPVYFSDSPVDWRSFISFPELLRRVPSESRYFLFHWRVSRGVFKVGRSAVPRPSAQEIAGYRILFESEDPLSDGNAGLMLLENTRL